MYIDDKKYYATKAWILLFKIGAIAFILISLWGAIDVFDGISNVKDYVVSDEYMNSYKEQAINHYSLMIASTLLIVIVSIILFVVLWKMKKKFTFYIPVSLSILLFVINAIGFNYHNFPFDDDGDNVKLIFASIVTIGMAIGWAIYKYRQNDDKENYSERSELLYNKGKYPVFPFDKSPDYFVYDVNKERFTENNKVVVPKEIIAKREADEKLIEEAEEGYRTAQWFLDDGWGRSSELHIHGDRWLDLKDNTIVYAEWAIKIGDEYKYFFIDTYTWEAVRLSDRQIIEDYHKGIKFNKARNDVLVKRVNMRLKTNNTDDYFALLDQLYSI